MRDFLLRECGRGRVQAIPDGDASESLPPRPRDSTLAVNHLLTTLIMAGGIVKYRHLSRDSAHRRALLRNLVTSLIEHESISTTWPKAKEAQKLAEKMITHGKKATEASRRETLKFFFVRCAVNTDIGVSSLTVHSDRKKCGINSVAPYDSDT